MKWLVGSGLLIGVGALLWLAYRAEKRLERGLSEVGHELANVARGLDGVVVVMHMATGDTRDVLDCIQAALADGARPDGDPPTIEGATGPLPADLRRLLLEPDDPDADPDR